MATRLLNAEMCSGGIGNVKFEAEGCMDWQ